MSKPVQRFGAMVGVKPEKLALYRELHAFPWPEVTALISASNIRNYSIHLGHGLDGRPYLYSYMEYAGSDFQGDMARMIADPVMQRWWRECVPCLEILPGLSAGEVWSPLEELFHLD